MKKQDPIETALRNMYGGREVTIGEFGEDYEKVKTLLRKFNLQQAVKVVFANKPQQKNFDVEMFWKSQRV